jgi:translation initiation factor 4E
MGVEETIDDQITPPNPNPNPPTEEAEELEEGEIVAAPGGEEGEAEKKSQHPLEHSWTFWFETPQGRPKNGIWVSNIRPVYTFSTIEQFWGLYNNIHIPSKLSTGVDFHCFKDKIEPKWEDPVCVNGGKWTAIYLRGKSDTAWLNTLLAMIGEQFDNGDEICGAVVSVRAKNDRIALWTKNASNEAAQLSIATQWKEFIVYNENIGYIFHEDSIQNDKGAMNRYHA